jgi:Ca2+-binding EF-hand superfamily protein
MVTGIDTSSLLGVMNTREMGNRPSPQEKFKEIDTDGDGTISVSELEAMTTEMASLTGQAIDATESVATYDQDGDGALSQSEMDSMMHEVMKKFGPPPGQNEGDAEFQQAMEAYLANQDSDQISMLLDQLGSQPVPPPPPDPAEKFAELDTNDDGGLSVDELEVMTAEMESMTGQAIDTEEAVATYDANEDGVLDQDEMELLMSELREELGPPPAMEEGATMADLFSSYLEDADSETLSSFMEIISNYVTSSGQTSGGVDIDV